ncbi:MAG TPA: nucleotidyltransferase, partial [Gemmatimonadales bacterium]|nr:nucleotidyltransferase [Gemmatimonadales bacterium]
MDWSHRIPEDQWRVYARVITEAREAAIGFAVGGAFGLAAYVGDLRNTKDLDLYILPESRHAMVEAMTRAGLSDLHDREPYDRAWIYRGHRDDIIVDAIWAMANLRAVVDPGWLDRGAPMVIHGERLRAIPAEELIWNKLYVFQRARCDWIDVVNLLDATLPDLDWDRLLARLGEDQPLLAGAVAVFAWLEPHRCREIPDRVWDRLGLDPLTGAGGREVTR